MLAHSRNKILQTSVQIKFSTTYMTWSIERTLSNVIRCSKISQESIWCRWTTNRMASSIRRVSNCKAALRSLRNAQTESGARYPPTQQLATSSHPCPPAQVSISQILNKTTQPRSIVTRQQIMVNNSNSCSSSSQAEALNSLKRYTKLGREALRRRPRTW